MYAIYDVSRLAFLGQVFPLSVALITLGLLMAIAVVFRGNRPNYAFFDGERRRTGEDNAAHSDLYFQAWILGLLVAAGVFGFVLGIFVYIATFLVFKAKYGCIGRSSAHWGAVTLLSALSYVLVLDYPRGLLQVYFELPWPFN